MTLTRFAFRLVALAAGVLVLSSAATQAACLRNVADGTRLMRASFGPQGVPPGHVGLTFVGHASFLIETAAGAKAVTDYNDLIRAPVTPDIVTMNIAHSTHHSFNVQPGVSHILHGWDTDGQPANHQVVFDDLLVRNVPTNIRDFETTRVNGNSIFVFETGGLCIAHLGHLHHRLTPEHLAALGEIDVVLVPVDGSYTLNIRGMAEVLDQIRAPLAIPMHYFSEFGLRRFLETIAERGTAMNYVIRFSETPSILLSRDRLPTQPEILVLPGR